MNKENDWDYIAEANMVVGPIVKITPKKVVIPIKPMRPGTAAGPYEACAEMISACGEVRISVMMEFCQRVLDGRGIPDKWQASVLVPILKKKRCKKL